MDQASKLRKLASFSERKIKPIEVEPELSKTKIITIASGKGGVGKTNIAINLGILFAKEGKNVVVMDADFGLANVNVILGVIPKYNLYHVLKGEKTLAEIMIETPQGIKIIAGASGFSKLADLDDDERLKFVEGLKTLSRADFVIIDTGAGVSKNVLSFLLAADEALIVTTPEPTAITDAYGIIKSISTEASDINIKLIVNRVHSIIEGKKIADRVINIASQFLNTKVESLGMIFEDDVVMRSVLRQKPFVVAFPKSKAAYSIDHLVKRLLNIEIQENTGGVSRFLKKFLSFYKE